MKRLAASASQEWAHPTASQKGLKPIRVVVRGRCLPFLLAGCPQLLSQGVLRRDTLMTTVFEGKTDVRRPHTCTHFPSPNARARITTGRPSRAPVVSQRRSLVVERVVINAVTSPALEMMRSEHKKALNPIVQQVGRAIPRHS